MRANQGEIHVRSWTKFQHPDVSRSKKGVPPWIRVYTELMSDEDFLRLSGHRRAVVLGIWLEYARTRRRLSHDTLALSQRLRLKVTTQDLEALNHAGFIRFSACKTQARNQQPASLDKKRRDKKEPVLLEAHFEGAPGPPLEQHRKVGNIIDLALKAAGA